MSKTRVNIARGDSYVENWLNFDYFPRSAIAKQANLLDRLPIAENLADVLPLEMLDQCVRRVSGGKLGACYARLQAHSGQHHALIDFVQLRTGRVLQSMANATHASRWSRILENPRKMRGKFEQWYVRLILALLPSAFRHQNVSLAAVGEKHAWMYDFYTLEQLLVQADFTDVKRMSACSSDIPNFPFQPLDLTADGQPRKGAESMYIEAVKL